MSNTSNTILIERAKDAIEYFEGTTTAKILRMHLEDHDLEALHESVKKAEAEMFQQEFNPSEVF